MRHFTRAVILTAVAIALFGIARAESAVDEITTASGTVADAEQMLSIRPGDGDEIDSLSNDLETTRTESLAKIKVKYGAQICLLE